MLSHVRRTANGASGQRALLAFVVITGLIILVFNLSLLVLLLPSFHGRGAPSAGSSNNVHDTHTAPTMTYAHHDDPEHKVDTDPIVQDDPVTDEHDENPPVLPIHPGPGPLRLRPTPPRKPPLLKRPPVTPTPPLPPLVVKTPPVRPPVVVPPPKQSPPDIEPKVPEPTPEPLPPQPSPPDNKSSNPLWREPAVGTCNQAFGNGFNELRSFCETGGQSSLKCHYSRTINNAYCDATNIMVDTSRIRVAHGGEKIEDVRNRPEDEEFPVYQQGAFTLNCQSSKLMVRKGDAQLQHHLADMLTTLEYTNDLPSKCEEWEDTPTLFVTRYEYANIYHTLGDWYNSYQALHMAGGGNMDVIFFDGHSSGALDEGWPALFNTGDAANPVKIRYVKHLTKSRTCFKRAIFVPPAYKSALGVDLMRDPYQTCARHPLLEDFASHFMSTFDIKQLKRERGTDEQVAVTIIFRRDYLAHPRLGTITASRKITNENEVETAARSISGTRVRGVSLSDMSLREQFELIHDSDILIGVHGAGMSHALFLPPTSGVLELMPRAYEARPHFRFFAQWSGLDYSSLPVPDSGRDIFTVPIASFTQSLQTMVTTVRGRIVRGGAATPVVTPPPAVTPPSPSKAIPPTPLDHPDMVDASIPNILLDRTPLATLLSQSVGGHRLAIIIPFRDSSSASSQGGNRTDNLRTAVPYLTKWLETPLVPGGPKRVIGKDFFIIVSEMTDVGHVFNKGAIFNAGFDQVKDLADYFVFHDVDQLPTEPTNTYQYFDVPVHLCSAPEQYNYQQAYGSMVGGALQLTKENYQQINGFSNFYWGWGQEDDDMYSRISRVWPNLKRLQGRDGRYRTLSHARVKDLDVTPLFRRGRRHMIGLGNGHSNGMDDGLNDLKYKIERTTMISRGVVRTLVHLDFPWMPTNLQDLPPGEVDIP